MSTRPNTSVPPRTLPSPHLVRSLKEAEVSRTSFNVRFVLRTASYSPGPLCR